MGGGVGWGASRLKVERLEDFWVSFLESRLSISAGLALPMRLLEAYKRRKTVRSFDSTRSPPKKEVQILFKFSDILDDSQKHSNTLLGQESKHTGTSGRRRGMQWLQAKALGSGSLASEMQLCNSHAMFRCAALATSLLLASAASWGSYLTRKCCEGEMRQCQ